MPDRPPDDSTPTRNEIDALRERAERAEREREALRRENERLRRENERLRTELEAARRAGCRQAAPFSKNRSSPHPRRPGRKPGPAYGRPAHRPVPTHIDDTYDAPLPAACPSCAGAVIATGLATQYQEDLPPVRPIVRAFHVHIGQCQRCGRRVQGRHPLQTSDALGAAAAQIGPRAAATAAVLHTQFGVPIGKVATLFQQHFGLTMTPSGIVHALHRAARQATPTYTALIETVRQSPMVVPDETGWRVGAQLQWLWVGATPRTTVYAIQPGRGFEQAAALLGADFAGVLVRDGWAPYRQFEQAAHQTCLAHLLRRCRELQTDHPRARSVRKLGPPGCPVGLRSAVRVVGRDADELTASGGVGMAAETGDQLAAENQMAPVTPMVRYAAMARRSRPSPEGTTRFTHASWIEDTNRCACA